MSHAANQSMYYIAKLETRELIGPYSTFNFAEVTAKLWLEDEKEVTIMRTIASVRPRGTKTILDSSPEDSKS